MVLVIPSIPIVHGVCSVQIASLAHEIHHSDGDIYSQNPVDRARLFRRENAKMLHLQFQAPESWDESSLAIIREMRDAVNIPFGMSLTELPPTDSDLETLFDAGILRVFLPQDTPAQIFLSYCERFTSRKIIPTIDLFFDLQSHLPLFRSSGIDRIALDLSADDSLESSALDWDRLREIAGLAHSASIRITALHGVRGYSELNRIQELDAALDSIVLCRAINENRFPCQLIWREVEAEAAFEVAPSDNLWTNPLEGKPHI